MRNAGAILNRLDGSDLVIGMHDADEDGARRDGLTKVAWINAASAVDRQISHARTQAFEKATRFNDRRVLDLGGDDVIALVAQCEERALEGEIIGLAAAAGKNDLIVVTA